MNRRDSKTYHPCLDSPRRGAKAARRARRRRRRRGRRGGRSRWRRLPRREAENSVGFAGPSGGSGFDRWSDRETRWACQNLARPKDQEYAVRRAGSFRFTISPVLGSFQNASCPQKKKKLPEDLFFVFFTSMYIISLVFFFFLHFSFSFYFFRSFSIFFIFLYVFPFISSFFISLISDLFQIYVLLNLLIFFKSANFSLIL